MALDPTGGSALETPHSSSVGINGLQSFGRQDAWAKYVWATGRLGERV